MKSMFAILKDKKVIPCGWFRHWRWLKSNPDRRVALDVVGEYTISTVFLHIAHEQYLGPDRYHWFETLVTHPTDDELEDHYSTWEEAEQGHAKFVALCRSKLG